MKPEIPSQYLPKIVRYFNNIVVGNEVKSLEEFKL